MTGTPVPAWVTDLIIAVCAYEERHGEGHDGWVCLAGVLRAVPPVVRDRAQAVADYRSSADRPT